jgi:hypothetical protein
VYNRTPTNRGSCLLPDRAPPTVHVLGAWATTRRVWMDSGVQQHYLIA